MRLSNRASFEGWRAPATWAVRFWAQVSAVEASFSLPSRISAGRLSSRCRHNSSVRRSGWVLGLPPPVHEVEHSVGRFSALVRRADLFDGFVRRDGERIEGRVPKGRRINK